MFNLEIDAYSNYLPQHLVNTNIRFIINDQYIYLPLFKVIMLKINTDEIRMTISSPLFYITLKVFDIIFIYPIHVLYLSVHFHLSKGSLS